MPSGRRNGTPDRFPVRGILGGWRDVWDEPDDHAELRAHVRPQSAGRPYGLTRSASCGALRIPGQVTLELQQHRPTAVSMHFQDELPRVIDGLGPVEIQRGAAEIDTQTPTTRDSRPRACP